MISSPSRGSWPLLFVGLGFAVLMGMAAALGRPALLAPFVGLIGLLILFVIPIRLAFWSIFVVSMLLVGPIMYFGRLDSARWIPPLLALAFYVPLAAFVLKPRKPTMDAGWPLWLFILAMFLVVAVCSTALSSPMVGEVAVASRVYFAFWSVALALAVGMLGQRDLALAWKALLVCAVVQLPVSLYQYLVVVKASTRLSPWDAVVGTFPGNMEGGGASHGLGIFLLIALATVLSLWRTRQIHRGLAILVLLSIFGTLTVSEVKAAVLLVPLVFALVYYRELLQRPMLSVGAILISVALMGTLILVYENTFYANRGMTLSGRMPTSPLEAVQNQLNPEQMHSRSEGGGVVVSRAARVADWWQRSVRYGDPFHALLGHGIGATQISSIGMGELVRQFPYPLDMTSTSILLWETGAIGHLLLMVMLLLAGINCASSARSPLVPVEHRALLEAAAAGLVIYAITLPYSSFALRAAPSQFLMVFMLGYSAYWWRIVRLGRLIRGADSVYPPQESSNNDTKKDLARKHPTPRYLHG